jgi:GNAT superfamily N-acetyltransferase
VPEPSIIRPIAPEDFAQWEPLWEAYNQFYERAVPRDVTLMSWSRFFDANEPVHALVAEADGALVGIAHYLFHRNTAMIAPTCYLQDLFTSKAARGRGFGRMMIEAVYAKARVAGSPRVYWMTQEKNETARRLYDSVAERSGFIQYRKQLG